MAKPQRRRRGFNTIDVTPLVDLTFLLLIVFMITSPVLENAIQVSPPSLNAAEIDPKEHRVVSVDKEGRVFLGSQQVSQDGLISELAQVYATIPKVQIFIRADETRQYGEVIGIMRRIQNLGIEEVSLVTHPEE